MNWLYRTEDDTWCLDGQDIQIRRGILEQSSGTASYIVYGARMIYHGTRLLHKETKLNKAIEFAESYAVKLDD